MAAPPSLEMDYYELLQIAEPSAASAKDIRRAYRQTSLKFHPDKAGDDVEAAAMFQLLQIAHNILTDPSTRATYDQTREAKQKRLAEKAKLDENRRRMVDALERKEKKEPEPLTTGLKRSWTGQEDTLEARRGRNAKRIAEENRKRMAALAQARRKEMG